MTPSTVRRWAAQMRFVGVAALGVAVLSAGAQGVASGADRATALPNPESARVELGRRLFFDPAASRSGMRSCADCHDPEHGYCDVEALSRDARGATPRRTQTLVDCVDSPTMDWLGAFDKIEEVVEARTETGAESNKPPPYYGGVITPTDPGLQFVAKSVPDANLPLPHEVLGATGRYRGAFMAAFHESNPTGARVVSAIAAYCKTIRSGESAYDRFVAGDKKALSESAQRGLELFQGSAGCASCHTMTGKRAAFTDYKFHFTGLPELAATPVPASPPAPRGGFKTPTLRDVASRGPFMHNGTLNTLDEVVRFFLARAERDVPETKPTIASPMADAELKHLAAFEADNDVHDLVAFLESLSSKTRPGAVRTAWSLRATKTRLRFVDSDGDALARWPVALEPAGDTMPGAPATRGTLKLVTDDKGWVTYTPPPTTHVRLVLEGGLLPEGGCWIPDTCTETKIVVPIGGIGHLRVTLPADAPIPDLLEATHEDGTLFPDRKPLRTIFRKDVALRAGNLMVVTYAATIRTDVKPFATLILPPGFFSAGATTTKVNLYAGNTTSVNLHR